MFKNSATIKHLQSVTGQYIDSREFDIFLFSTEFSSLWSSIGKKINIFMTCESQGSITVTGFNT